MSFHSWLHNLRSALARGRGQRHHRRRHSLRAATHRPNLEVLEDRLTPSFSPATSYPVGVYPQAVVTADFNRDGKLDLATADYNLDYNGTVSVLLGDGRGGFGAANHFAAGANPGSVAVGDFDNDGKLDLATANQGSWDVSVLLGNGDGSFRPPVSTALWGGEPLAVAVADFDADGKMDLAVTTHFDYALGADPPSEFGYVEVLLGDGRGGVAAHSMYDAGSGLPYGLAVADLNADGKPDVATANDDYDWSTGSYYDTVSVRLGNGDGTLGAPSWSGSLDTGPSPPAVVVGDFTGDGIPDLVTGVQVTVDVLPGNGDGTFASPISSSNSSGRAAVADLNGDGKLDLVSGNIGSVGVLLGNGDGTLRYGGAFPAGWRPDSVAAGDFNGDGRPDVAAAPDGSTTMISVLLNDGDWDSVPPRLRIYDVTVTEGNTGTVSATFTVTLSAASTETIAVAYATADGTATAGSDYQAVSGTLTFAPGETSKAITVQVIGDRLPEPNETFVVNLSSPTNATIADGQGMGTIIDDEPRISISDVTKYEGSRGQTTLFVFTVTLSAAYDQRVTMSFRTVDGTATTSDKDYVAQTGTVTFAPGETTKTITIQVKGDSKREADETFFVDLFGNSGNSLFTKNRGTGTILNDD